MRGTSRATRTLRLVLAGAAVVCAVAVSASAALAFPAWPTHRCGSFHYRIPPEYGLAAVHYRINVYNGHVSCSTATRLIRGFWLGKPVHHGGPSDAQSWWTLKGLPGWRCREGAGAGSCTRHNSIAAYEVRVI